MIGKFSCWSCFWNFENKCQLTRKMEGYPYIGDKCKEFSYEPGSDEREKDFDE